MNFNSGADKKKLFYNEISSENSLSHPRPRRPLSQKSDFFHDSSWCLQENKFTCFCMCSDESHFIIFSMDDFWLALMIVTNQSQQSLALDVDVLEFASQAEILRKLIHFCSRSPSLSLPRTDSFFVLWSGVFFCWSERLLLRYLSDGVHRIFSLFRLLLTSSSRSTFFMSEHELWPHFVCFARAYQQLHMRSFCWQFMIFRFLENCFSFSRSFCFSFLHSPVRFHDDDDVTCLLTFTKFSDPWICL